MDTALNAIYANGSLVVLSGLVAAAMFFVVVGIRELRDEHQEGLLYLITGLFFFVAHFYYLANLPDSTPVGSVANLQRVFMWLSVLFAPALISLFLLLGLFNFAFTQRKLGLTKMFFGISLVAYLYWVGAGWATDIKGILTVVWTMVWFDIELETVS